MALKEVTEWKTIDVKKMFSTNILEIISSSIKLVDYQIRLSKVYTETKQSYLNNGWTITADEPNQFTFIVERKYTIDE